MHHPRFPSIATALAFFLFQIPCHAAPDGLANFGARFSHATSDRILEGDLIVEGVPIKSQTVTLFGSYNPVEIFGLRASLSANSSSYDGPSHLAHGDNDDGDTHSALTDLMTQVNYFAYEGDYVNVAPLLRLILPASDYETRGFAASGLGLKQYGLGLEVGAQPYFDNLYVSTSFVYSIVERLDKGGKTKDINIDRQEFNALLSYQALRKLGVSLGIEMLKVPGGIELAGWQTFDPELKEWHDSLAKVESFTAGFGVDYQVSGKSSVGIDYRFLVDGDNISDGTVISVGYTRSDFF